MFRLVPGIEFRPIGQVGQSCPNDENGGGHGRLLGGLSSGTGSRTYLRLERQWRQWLATLKGSWLPAARKVRLPVPIDVWKAPDPISEGAGRTNARHRHPGRQYR